MFDTGLAGSFTRHGRQRDNAHLINREVTQTATDIALCRIQQRTEQRCAHLRLFRTQGIEQLHGLSTPVIGRDQLRIVVRGTDKRIVENFNHAAVGE